MRIVLLMVAVLLILLLALASRTRRPPIQSAGVDPLAAQLQRWAGDGLLSQEQATAILTAERAQLPRPAPPARPARPASVLVELLGYLGGTLAIVGAGLLAARFWPDLDRP